MRNKKLTAYIKGISEFILHLKNYANSFVLNFTVYCTKFHLLSCMYFPNKDEIILTFDSVSFCRLREM